MLHAARHNGLHAALSCTDARMGKHTMSKKLIIYLRRLELQAYRSGK